MEEASLLWTPRFQANFRRYNGVSDYVIKKSAELVKRARANPSQWHFELEKLKDDSLRGISAYRFKITSGDRLVVVASGSKIILADIGNHEVMAEYSRMNRSSREEDLRRACRVDEPFMTQVALALADKKQVNPSESPPGLNGTLDALQIEGETRWLYEEELSENWVNFLDDEQFAISETLFGKLSIPAQEISVEFIMGGPGTGKTVILLNLAKNLESSGRSVSFMASDNVIKYLKSGGNSIPGANLGFGPGVVALVDDPASSKELADHIRKAKSAGCRAIVVGFDPLQWHERKMESNFKKIKANHEYNFYPLRVCYRQSSGVGRNTVELANRIYRSSSRYLDSIKQTIERKEMQPYIDLSLGMSFVDDSGRFIVYMEDVEENYTREINRFRERIDRWKHTSPIVFVYEDSLSSSLIKSLRDAAFELNRTEIPLSKYHLIRGVEYQELFLFVSMDFWKNINQGRSGVGSEEWERIACLHTILSRPKDSLVLFVCN